MDKILVLCGMSSTGKDSIQKELVEKYGYKSLVSHTTRPIRTESEIDGVNYYFVDKDNFEKMEYEEKFIETRFYKTYNNGVEDVWYYGLSKEELNKNGNKVVILDLKGAKEFTDYIGKENALVCYVHAPYSVRLKRAINRGNFEEQEWHRRDWNDKNDFSILKVSKIANMSVENIDLKQAVSEILIEHNGDGK